MNKLFNSILIKKDGVWEHTLSVKKEEYTQMLIDLPDGTKMDMTIEVSGKGATYPQMKRIHAMIRQLVSDTGGDFADLKLMVKKNSGLCIDNNCKSFADCDTEQLNGAIQACIEIGDFCGSNLR
tara:strand:+ start:314 stop:685 length:372 start_codon:yes stop_codon:yes gene_type:complete